MVPMQQYNVESPFQKFTIHIAGLMFDCKPEAVLTDSDYLFNLRRKNAISTTGSVVRMTFVSKGRFIC